MSELEQLSPPDAPHHELTPAHAVVILLFALTVIAAILGIATGSVNEHFLEQPPAATSITVP